VIFFNIEIVSVGIILFQNITNNWKENPPKSIHMNKIWIQTNKKMLFE
jgi:hypothetical protein